MSTQKDTIYASPLSAIGRFEFDAGVVNVFPDMIQRSVPGYSTIIHAIGLLAGRYALPNSQCYDLGCSLGAASWAMQEQVRAENCRIVAVDNSPAMLEQLRSQLINRPHKLPIDVLCEDIRAVDIENASVVVLNFTLQFVPLADRLAFLKKIYQGLLPGGILILSEKLCFEDARQEVLQSEMHHAFKKAQGYSDLEISQKRSALEDVLIPETLAMHQARLKAVGFSSTEVWFQYFNFASLISLK